MVVEVPEGASDQSHEKAPAEPCRPGARGFYTEAVKWKRPAAASTGQNGKGSAGSTALLEGSYSAVLDAAAVQAMSPIVLERTRYRALATDLLATAD